MTTVVVDCDSVFEIAQAVFAAMVDGEDGLLVPLDGVGADGACASGIGDGAGGAGIDDLLIAWVDIHGHYPGRAAVFTGTSTAHTLVRGLLNMSEDEPVSDADLIDAFGEIANVVGGNVKGLLPDQCTLGLPHVSTVLPLTVDPLAATLRMLWRGQPLDVVVWLARGDEGENR